MEILRQSKSMASAPAFGANIWLSDNDRVYARYIETVRLPVSSKVALDLQAK